ncbi:hypothetical protein B0T10DRAFT_602699 [Thelonectria olida]|uniref:Cupin type-2 domain-containing protein n=1 Tax=Thelonectria olida TaxID=1576542 RepID=A0A9P8WH39_9HYPO|nr:hypothetical protein B0T10DRAFT_602699 [Thelonectria olida]
MSSGSDWQSPLPENYRHITTHDKHGKSVYSNEVECPLNLFTVDVGDGRKAGFELAYTTRGFPVPLANDQDLQTYKEAYATKKEDGLVRKGGTILRYVDIPPGQGSPMHRTVSLDYGIVVAGEVECILDSGQIRTMRAGDVMVQRGTNHEWLNRGTEWARIVFILIESTPVVVDGKELVENVGGMDLAESH